MLSAPRAWSSQKLYGEDILTLSSGPFYNKDMAFEVFSYFLKTAEEVVAPGF